MVSDPGIDIADICTPNDSHCGIALAAAAHGKAILCEKPLSTDVAGGEAMVAAVKRAKVVHPFAGCWWPPGHIVGYEHTFVNTFADFVNAVVAGRSVQPTFADGLANEKVLSAISESARKRAWVRV